MWFFPWKNIYIYKNLILYDYSNKFISKSFFLFLLLVSYSFVTGGSHPYEKTMSSIVLKPDFYEYKNAQS